MIERREAVRERIGTGTAPLDGKIRERVEEAKTRLAEARAEQMKDFVRKTIARMRAAIERLSKLADRIDSRMKKLEAAQQEAKNALSTSSEGRGKVSVQDLSLCFKCTARARAAIDEAKAALAEAEAKFASYTPPTPADDEHVPGTPTRPQPGLGQPSPIREDLKKAEAAIRTAHRALVEAIASMRNIPVAAKASDVTSSQ
jgi:DNA repair exonuclease SbcCD ATPase subunit